MNNNEFEEPTLEMMTFTNEREMVANSSKPWNEGEWGGPEQPDN